MCGQTQRSSRCAWLYVHVGIWLSGSAVGWEAAEISGVTTGLFFSQEQIRILSALLRNITKTADPENME